LKLSKKKEYTLEELFCLFEEFPHAVLDLFAEFEKGR